MRGEERRHSGFDMGEGGRLDRVGGKRRRLVVGMLSLIRAHEVKSGDNLCPRSGLWLEF